MKKLDQKSIDALQRPDTKVVAVDMTPEKKARFKLASDEIITVLKKHTTNPVEAYMLLKLMLEGFEETYDIRGGMICRNDDPQKGD